MNYLLLIAGGLCILLGAVHSILGERLIFMGWRKTPPNIPRQHQGIIWATWHLATFLAFGLASFVIAIAMQGDALALPVVALNITAAMLFLSAAFVHVGTKGKHPGWIVLSLIALLISLAPYIGKAS